MNFITLTETHPLWSKTIDYARNCGWNGGKFLAMEMEMGQPSQQAERHPPILQEKFG